MAKGSIILNPFHEEVLVFVFYEIALPANYITLRRGACREDTPGIE